MGDAAPEGLYIVKGVDSRGLWYVHPRLYCEIVWLSGGVRRTRDQQVAGSIHDWFAARQQLWASCSRNINYVTDLPGR